MPIEQKASDLFGGKQTLRKTLVDRIKQERIRAKFTPQEMYFFANLESHGYSPDTVEKIEEGKMHLDELSALNLMAPLGITIDSVTPPPPLSDTQRLH